MPIIWAHAQCHAFSRAFHTPHPTSNPVPPPPIAPLLFAPVLVGEVMSRGAQREQLTPPKPHSLKMVKTPASVPTPCPHSASNQRAGNLGPRAEPGETRDFLTLAVSFPVIHSCEPRDHRRLLPGGEVHELVAGEFTFLLLLPHLPVLPHLLQPGPTLQPPRGFLALDSFPQVQRHLAT